MNTAGCKTERRGRIERRGGRGMRILGSLEDGWGMRGLLGMVNQSYLMVDNDVFQRSAFCVSWSSLDGGSACNRSDSLSIPLHCSYMI